MTKTIIFLCFVYALAVACDGRQTFKQVAEPAQHVPKVKQHNQGEMLQATKADTVKEGAPLKGEQFQSTKGAPPKQKETLEQFEQIKGAQRLQQDQDTELNIQDEDFIQRELISEQGQEMGQELLGEQDFDTEQDEIDQDQFEQGQLGERGGPWWRGWPWNRWF